MNQKAFNQSIFLHRAMILLVILIATWLRLYALAEIPWGMWFDEGYNALEAIGILETGDSQIFFIGNNGREPLFLYLSALAVQFLGAKPYSLRVVSAIGGIISVPLLFRLTTCLFKQEPYRYWLGLVASAGLATSFWHLGVSRIGLRAGLLLPFIILCSYLFWRGIQTRRYGYFVGAGAGLGLSQYTYLAARLPPLLFLLYAVGWSVFYWRQKRSSTLFLWRGIILMGLVAGIVFLPLGLFFVLNPGTFSNRIENILPVAPETRFTSGLLVEHLFKSLRLFVGAGGVSWRYTLPTRPLLDWTSFIGFWLGVFFVARQFRKPAHLFIFSGLFVMWLPGFLSQDPVHELRQLGLLPFYYILVAIGLVGTGEWVLKKLCPRVQFWYAGLSAVLVVLLVSGSLNFDDYFYRWAGHPETYRSKRGEVFDITHLAAELSKTTTVVLPFETYAYPSARLLLHEDFEERALNPAEIIQALAHDRQATLIGPSDNWPPQSGLAWLTLDEAGNGVIYISNLLPRIPFDPNDEPQSVLNSYGATIGYKQQLNVAELEAILSEVDPIREMQFEFADLLRLVGYHLTPSLVMPGGFSALDLYWQGVSTEELNGDVFVQLVDSNGTPVLQMHEAPFSSGVSRWHWNVIIPGRHLIWTGADLPGGVYVVQIGLFDPGTQARFPIATADGQVAGDQVPLGLLYVTTDDGSDPRIPEVPFEVKLDNNINLLGFSVSRTANDPSSVDLALHWYSEGNIVKDHSIFAQLLDSQGHINVQVESQPLNGLYPTSHWQTGEIVVDHLILPYDQRWLSEEYNLAIGMYDPEVGTPVKILDWPEPTLESDKILLRDLTLP